MTDATPRSRGRSSRRRARELALQGTYEFLVKGTSDLSDLGAIDAFLREQEDYAEADGEYLHTLFYGAMHQAPALRERFSPYVDRAISELSPVEHGILLLGSYELLHHPEIPYKVVINEAVELAKEFGGTDGFKFVNGVLDRVAAEVRAAEIQASARR